MNADNSIQQAWTGGKNPWAIAFVVTLATFMEMLDTSIANVALAHMAGNLSVTLDQTTWVLTTYLMANAIVLPISGWLSTKLGRKRYYMISVALFTISSALCGAAPSLEWLVIFRVLQGIGGGGLAPVEQSILADTFPPAKRGMAMAMYGMSIVMAPAIGPTVGGFITDNFSWRWLFFINIPVGLLSLMLTQRLVSDPPYLTLQKAHAGAVDYVGLVLLALGLGCLELTLSRGQDEDWFHSNAIVSSAVICVVALVGFVIWESRQTHPIVDVKLLMHPGFAAINAMMVCTAVVLYGTTTVLPQYMQSVMHYTASQAGGVLSPGGIAIVMLMPLVGRLVTRVDPRLLVAFGFAVTSCALLYMAQHLYPGIDHATAIKLRVLQSLGIAFLFVPINTLAYEGFPLSKRNTVASIVNLSRNLGGSLGISFVTTLIARRSQVHRAHLAENITPDGGVLPFELQTLTAALERSGAGASEALQQAYAFISQRVGTESITLSTLEALYALALYAACMVPLVATVRRSASSSKAAVSAQSSTAGESIPEF